MPETLHSRLFRIIVVWLLALCPAVVVAAAARVSNLNISHGLPDNYVTGVAQDRQGFMWFATEEGVCRFDGRRFRSLSERNSPLSGNSVNAIFYDSIDNKLYVGSKKGLDRIDCFTGRFDCLIMPDIPEEINSVNVVGFARDPGNDIWILNRYNFILRYSHADRKFRIYTGDSIPALKWKMAFHSIAADSAGRIYLGHENYGFSILDPSTMQVVNIPEVSDGSSARITGDVRAIHIDRYENIWVGTGQGLALYNPVSCSFTPMYPDGQTEGMPPAFSVHAIAETADGRLWVGADPGGLAVIDIRDISISNPRRFASTVPEWAVEPRSGAPRGIRGIFQDSYGNIWMATYGQGLDFISHLPPLFSAMEAGSGRGGVWALHTDGSGALWAGKEGEIVRRDASGNSRTYSLARYLADPRSRIMAISEVPHGILFSAFNEGVFILHQASGSVRKLPLRQEGDYAGTIVTLGDGSTLIGTQHGLYVYSDGALRRDDRISGRTSWLAINGIIVDSRGRIWAGTYGDGIHIFDRKNEKFILHEKNGLVSNAVKQIYRDSRGWIWVAAQDGISLIKDDANPDRTVNFGYKEGLEDIHIRAVAEDEEGNMWFASDNRLTRWHAATGRFANYDIHDGLAPDNITDRAACRTPGGSLWFGTMGGICTFSPEAFSTKTYVPPVRIAECVDLLDGDKPVDLASESGRCAISVPYSGNSLKISFSTPDYAYNGQVEYSYMLEHSDRNWISAGTVPEAVLRDIPVGDHRLLVRARLRDGGWEQSGTASVLITVVPPIWFTWYAKLFYVLLVVLAIYLVAQQYRRRLIMRNSLEMERRKRIDQQELNNEKLRFYTNVTHELRTPLTLIIGPLEDLAEDRDIPAEPAAKIRTIRSSAIRLLDLVNRLLEFRKTETHHRRLSVRKGRIAEVVAEVGMRYGELNRNADLSVSLEIPPDLPEIYFDRDLVHTVINNLMSNAMKYTPKGKITLGATLSGSGSGRYIDITVSDTGHGIGPAALPHIFDRYYQASDSPEGAGTGIGLALVKSLAELHDAAISVESTPGQGSVFHFRLKVDVTYPEALHPGENPEDGPGTNTLRSEDIPDNAARPLVLVVEDNEEIRSYIRATLSSFCNVIEAPDGREGIIMARRRLPDLIVSDIMMPHKDGIELCHDIKSDVATSHIPVILLTAKDSLSDREQGYDIGADSYITKPFSARLLIARIRNLLEARRRLAEALSLRLRSAEIPSDTSLSEPDASAPWPSGLGTLDREFIGKFTQTVNDNMARCDVDMAFMQKAMHMSHSTLYRKIRSLTGISCTEFIRKLKLKRGYALLMEGHGVAESAYECGFSDAGYFGKVFREEFGILPSQIHRDKPDGPHS